MDFLSFLIDKNNIFISAAAVFSGAMLLIPSFRKGGSAGVNTSQAISMANQRQAVWVDIRPADQFKNGHIAQARNVPATELDEKASALPKNKPLIVVCAAGREANRAAAKLRAQGFSDVVPMAGGMRAWADANLPIVKKA